MIDDQNPTKELAKDKELTRQAPEMTRRPDVKNPNRSWAPAARPQAKTAAQPRRCRQGSGARWRATGRRSPCGRRGCSRGARARRGRAPWGRGRSGRAPPPPVGLWALAPASSRAPPHTIPRTDGLRSTSCALVTEMRVASGGFRIDARPRVTSRMRVFQITKGPGLPALPAAP